MSVLGWIITVGIFLFAMSASYSTAGLGGSVLIGGSLALMYVARAGRGGRPSPRPEPITLDAYGREALGNLTHAFARSPRARDGDVHQYLIRRGRAPVGREQVGLIRLAALMQRAHENPIDDTDFAALRANSEAMDRTFKLIYGQDPSDYERSAFSVMIHNAYPAKEKAERMNFESARITREALRSYAEDGTQRVKMYGASGPCTACAAVAGRLFALAAAPPVPVPGCSSKICRCYYRPVVEEDQP